LFNRLVERERAIVTATPGTTRDLVSETVAIGGIPIQLVDTAGIRQALDEAESIGIRKSMEALADADLVLAVLDASQPATIEDHELQQQTANRPVIVVENKSDLLAPNREAIDQERMDQERKDGERTETTDRDADGSGKSKDREGHGLSRATLDPLNDRASAPEGRAARVRASALTGEGIAELRAEILRHIGGETGAQTESGFLTNVRHQGLVQDSLAALAAATGAVAAKVPHEMLLLDLYNALRPLDAVTGATTTDDILNLIFSKFCIGK